jgi:TolA-binding protein
MSDAGSAKGLRERLAGGTEERLGKAITDLFDNPLINGALGRASDAREKAFQAQELAMGALNLPSAADVERLTRRLRSVSQRLEEIEDGVHRIGRTLSGPSIETRLAAIEEQLKTLSGKLDPRGSTVPQGGAESRGPAVAKRPAAKRSAAKRSGSATKPRSAAKGSAPKHSAAKAPKPAR